MYYIIAGRLKCCGMEDRTVVANGYWKTKKLICGMEGKNVVTYGRLPSLLSKLFMSKGPLKLNNIPNLAHFSFLVNQTNS